MIPNPRLNFQFGSKLFIDILSLLEQRLNATNADELELSLLIKDYSLPIKINFIYGAYSK